MAPGLKTPHHEAPPQGRQPVLTAPAALRPLASTSLEIVTREPDTMAKARTSHCRRPRSGCVFARCGVLRPQSQPFRGEPRQRRRDNAARRVALLCGCHRSWKSQRQEKAGVEAEAEERQEAGRRLRPGTDAAGKSRGWTHS